MACNKNNIIEDIVREIRNNVERVARDRGGRTPLQKVVAGSKIDIILEIRGR